jgi:tetratricopeptide (TPR) repeat protein
MSILKKSLERDSHFPYPYSSVGIYHELRKEFGEAEKNYREALQYHPRFSRALLGLARLKRYQGNFPEAIQYVRQILEIDSQNGDAYLLLSELSYEASPLKSIEILEQGIRESPTEANLHLALGQMLIENRQLDKAVEHLKNYQKLAPDAANLPQVEALIQRCHYRLEKDESRLNLLLEQLTNLATPYAERRKAAKALQETPQWDQKTYDTVLKAFQNDEDYAVRIFCIRALSEHTPSTETLELFIQRMREDDHHLVRATLAKHLGELKAKKAVPVLIGLLEEEDAYFMELANEALNLLTENSYSFKTSNDPSEQQERLGNARHFWKGWMSENAHWIAAYAY